jgi:hypothetical protein
MTDGYGPELVTNGNFSSSDLSDWTIEGGTASVDGGRLFAVAGSGGFVYASQSFTTKVGVRYILTLNLDGGTSTNNYVALGTSSNNSAYSYVNIGTGRQSYEVTFTATETTSVIKFSTGIGSGKSSFWDNVSVREMPVIKWGPHNLVTHSEDATEWTSTGGSATNTGLPDPSGGSQAVEWTFTGINQQLYNRVTVALADYTAKCWVKGISGETINLTGFGLVTLTGDWQLVSAPQNADSTPEVNLNTFGGATARVIQVWGAHVYRSDLGGMVDNPDQPPSRASYVPTTSSDKYLPRVGHHVYNGSAWVNEGVLAESESRTNLIQYSDASSGWSASAGTLTANSGVSPDGSENASSFVENNNSANHQIVEASISGLLANVDNTFSAYVKTLSGSRYAQLRIYGVGTDKGWASFDLSSGVLSGSGGTSLKQSTIQNIGNGWFRVSITTNHATTYGVSIALADSGATEAPAYTGDSTSGIYFYGIQVEQGSTPSSLIPTSGSSVSRAAETFTIPSANLPWPPEVLSGVEEVTSGTFDTAAALDDFGTSGTVTYDTATQSARLQPNSQLTQFLNGTDNVSGTYKISWNQTLVSGTRTRLLARNHPNNNYLTTAYFYGSGEKSIVVTTTDGVMFRINSDNSEALMDNISVQKVEDIAVSIGMEGRMTRESVNGSVTAMPIRWVEDGNNQIRIWHDSSIAGNGIRWDFDQEANNVIDQVSSGYINPFGILVPFDIASRHGSTFINGATDGVALTADTTPTDLPDLSSTDLDLAYDYMGTISEFRIWDKDLGDAGLVEATNPSLEPSLSLTFEGTGTNSFVVNNWSE